jgi:hypothetical protein
MRDTWLSSFPFSCCLRRDYRPFSGEYLKLKENGMYACVVCGQELFSSECKYESGCGWPAFFQPEDDNKLILRPDVSHGQYILLFIIYFYCTGYASFHKIEAWRSLLYFLALKGYFSQHFSSTAFYFGESSFPKGSIILKVCCYQHQ